MTVTGETETNHQKGEKGEIIIMESNKKFQSKEFYDHAPLAAPEDDSDDLNLIDADEAEIEAEAHYSQIQINENNFVATSLNNQTANINQFYNTFSNDQISTTNKIKSNQRHRRDKGGQQST